jgi:kinesin family protein 13
MISTISPSFDNYEETLSTLRYADRAKRIVNNAVVNEDPNAKIIRNLREELETLKKELEIAKEKINKDAVKVKLNESEKLYIEFSKTWAEKLAETEKIQNEYNSKLKSMGISVQSSGIKVEKEKYYLVNLNADPSMNELLVYYLKVLLFFNFRRN